MLIDTISNPVSARITEATASGSPLLRVCRYGTVEVHSIDQWLPGKPTGTAYRNPFVAAASDGLPAGGI